MKQDKNKEPIDINKFLEEESIDDDIAENSSAETTQKDFINKIKNFVVNVFDFYPIPTILIITGFVLSFFNIYLGIVFIIIAIVTLYSNEDHSVEQKVCPKCRKEVDDLATRCPYCRSKITTNFFLDLIGMTIVSILIISVIFILIFKRADIINYIKDKVAIIQVERKTDIPTTIVNQIITNGGNDLTPIISKWRKNTPYIICFWINSNGTQNQIKSGSGFLAILNSIPTIITNKHVVIDPTYGTANECDVRFPDDNGFYFYSNNNPNSQGGYYPDRGIMTIDSNGYDVAFITGIDSTWTSLSSSYTQPQPPTISLSDHTASGYSYCKKPLNIGDGIVVLGYPTYGTPMESVLNSPAEITATDGIISGKDGIYYTTSAKIEHGNSGGLAIDQKNNCYFGIPTWNESGAFESLGRILPSSTFIFY